MRERFGQGITMAPHRGNIDRSAIPIFFTLVAAALIVAALCGGPLSWDGAFYLFFTLDRQIPFFSRARAINAVLETPVLAVSHFSDNFMILRAVFCICYASVPGLGLALSWIACRASRPALFIWPALSISLAMLPGQFCFNSEAFVAASFTWPVFLAGLIGPEPGLLPVLVLLEVMVWFTHPIAVALSAFAALATAVSASRLAGHARSTRFAGAFLLAVLALSRVFAGFSPYEHQMMSLQRVTGSFRWSVLGWPLVSLAFVSAAALQCLRGRAMNRPADESQFGADYLLAGAVLAAGMCLIPWSLVPRAWAASIGYRLWVAPVSLALMTGCALDAWRSSPAPSWTARKPALIAIGSAFFIVLSLQSATWVRLKTRFVHDLHQAGSGCVPRSSLKWIANTPLNHWSIAAYSIVLQGRTPQVLVLDDDNCDTYAKNREVNIIWFSRASGRGWFDLDHAGAQTGSAVRE